MKRSTAWALPGVIFAAAYGASALWSAATSPPSSPEVKKDPDACPMVSPDEARREREERDSRIGGPLAIPDARQHGCQKIAYESLRTFLQERGVNVASTAQGSAGVLLKNAADTFGVPKVDSRLGERSFHTTASATKLFDVFIVAAPEIIANIAKPASAPACKLDDEFRPMFDPVTGDCVSESVSCLLARPATADDLTLCNAILDEAVATDAADLAMKRRIAVATLLSAAHTCE